MQLGVLSELKYVSSRDTATDWRLVLSPSSITRHPSPHYSKIGVHGDAGQSVTGYGLR